MPRRRLTSSCPNGSSRHAREHEPARRIVVERRRQPSSTSRHRELELVDRSGGQLDELRLGDPTAREADGRDDGAGADDRAELGLECLRRALDRPDRRGRSSLAGRDRGEELGQLLGGPGTGVPASAHRQDDQRLVVEAGWRRGCGRSRRSVEAGDRRAAGVSGDRVDLALEPSSPRTPRRATQSNASRPSGVAPSSASSASRQAASVASSTDVDVALQEPGDRRPAAPRRSAERAVLEVRARRRSARCSSRAAAAEPERMGHAELGERRRVGARLGGRVEALEVDVERRPVVERVDAVAARCG